MKNKMQVKSIISGSSQWNYAEFRLQLILSHPNIQILSIQTNPNAHNFFQSKQAYFTIDAAADLTQENQDQVNYYKTNQKKGCIFKCGRIQQQCKLQDGMGNTKIYRIVLFKIAVKNILPIYQSSAITKDDLSNYTKQYDSIYLTSKKEELSVYDHQYFLRSVTQYVWEFDIQYRYINANEPNSKVKKWNPEIYRCQQCLNQKAFWYCVEERLLFCKECYEQIHKPKYRNPHHKEMLNPFNCHKNCHRATHNQQPLQFYCFNCKCLKCQKCLSDSVHGLNRIRSNRASQSEGSSKETFFKKGLHSFEPVRQLIKYLQQKQQYVSQQLKHKLIQKIKVVEQVIALKSKKYNQKLRQYQEALVLSLQTLRRQSRKEINEAVSVQIQLKRKFDQILWIEQFVTYNQDTLDAQSNIKFKEVFSSFLNFMNSEEYFKKIDKKIFSMTKTNENK